jgi:hypothetical protein
MTDILTNYAIVILIGLVSVIVIAISYLQKRAYQNAWGELASRLGLQYTQGNLLKYPSVTGIYRSRNVTLDVFMRGTSKNRTTYTRIVLEVNNSLQRSMKIYQETIFSKVGKLIGGQDLQIGNEQFDQRYIIKGQPELDVVKMLSSIGLQQKLLLDRTFNFELKGSELYFEKRGIERNVDQLQREFDLLCDIAEAIEHL